jgi:hypothetical protein
MKTDDDAFVRVDEIHSSVKQLNVSHGLLYGRINSDSGPHRNPESKWYISPEVMSAQQSVLCNQIHKSLPEKHQYCKHFQSELIVEIQYSKYTSYNMSEDVYTK